MAATEQVRVHLTAIILGFGTATISSLIAGPPGAVLLFGPHLAEKLPACLVAYRRFRRNGFRGLCDCAAVTLEPICERLDLLGDLANFGND